MSFTVSAEQFAYVGADYRRIVEPARVTVHVGPRRADLRSVATSPPGRPTIEASTSGALTGRPCLAPHHHRPSRRSPAPSTPGSSAASSSTWDGRLQRCLRPGIRRRLRRLAHRRRRPGRASASRPALPGRQLRVGLQLGDGVGPRSCAPAASTGPGRSIEPNPVGTDEFMALAQRMGSTPMLAVNLGTRPAREARALVEYLQRCARHTGRRSPHRATGIGDPYGVRLWCLGNEMDGRWQIGHATAAEYVDRATDAAGDARRRPAHRDRRLRLLGSDHADVRHVGPDRAQRHGDVGRPSIAPPLLRATFGATRRPSWPALVRSTDRQIDEVTSCRR